MSSRTGSRPLRWRPRPFLDRVPAGFRVGLATFSATSAGSGRADLRPHAGLGCAGIALAVDAGTGTVIVMVSRAALVSIDADRNGGIRPAAIGS